MIKRFIGGKDLLIYNNIDDPNVAPSEPSDPQSEPTSQPENNKKKITSGVFYTSEPNVYVAPLIGPIFSLSDYAYLADFLIQAKETDTIKILIDSEGGCVFTSSFLAELIKNSAAKTIGVAHGAVMSCASTIIWPACKEHEIRPGAIFMFHGTSNVSFGKTYKILQEAMAITTYFKSLLTIVKNMNMLTDEEMNEITEHKGTVFIDAETMKSRFFGNGGAQ